MRTCKGCTKSELLEHDCISCKIYGILVSDTQAKKTYVKKSDENGNQGYVPEKCEMFKERRVET